MIPHPTHKMCWINPAPNASVPRVPNAETVELKVDNWDRQLPAGPSPFLVRPIIANRSTYQEWPHSIRMPLYVANPTVADQWGVPHGTPFVRLDEVCEQDFNALKEIVGIQLELERGGVVKDLEKHLPLRQHKIYVDDLEDTISTIAHLVGFEFKSDTTADGLIEAVRALADRVRPTKKPGSGSHDL